MTDRVLVTGGSGFVGAHCVLALLEAGYSVRTTIRSPQRAADVRSQLAEGAKLREGDSEDAGDRLEFAVADLLDDAGWSEAVDGCRFVLHVASPFPMTEPKDPDELVRPAREGALRVLRAARDAGVERVVLTSSFAAIGYGHAPTRQPFTEVDWTELDSGRPISAYVRSKTLAEHAAWDFIAKEGGSLELATVNPVGILGPVLGPDYSSSVELVKLVREGRLPRLPDVYFGVVDVRDVAGLHLLAMTKPEAAGERFLATAGDALGAPELALIIRGHLGSPAGDRVRTAVMPSWVLKAAAPFSRRVRGSLPDIGVYRNGSSAKARTVLGWRPRSREEAVIATVDSLPPRLH